MSMLPNARLLARAFQRSASSPSTSQLRRLSTGSPKLKEWTGRQPEENTSRNTDHHNAQQDASAEGKRTKASGETSSSATSEKDVNKDGQKAKEEFPEAPKGPVIGMNDERGGKGAANSS